MYISSTTDDLQLLQLLKESSIPAFSEIYNRHHLSVYKSALKILGSKEDAEDVVQEIFTSLWERKEALSVDVSFSAYLYKSTKYTCLRIIEKNIRKYTYRQSLSNALEQISLPDAEDKSDTKMLESAIDNVVNELPDRMKQAFLLSRKENLTHREIAKKMNISEATVKKQIHYALKIIRRNLGNLTYIGCFLSYCWTISR